MKITPLTLVLTASLVIMTVFYTINTIEQGKENDLLQRSLDGQKRQNKKERQNLENELKATRDSLTIAFQTIRLANKESAEAHARSQATIKNLRAIIFVSHSDSSRNQELKSLYKSFNP